MPPRRRGRAAKTDPTPVQARLLEARPAGVGRACPHEGQPSPRPAPAAGAARQPAGRHPRSPRAPTRSSSIQVAKKTSGLATRQKPGTPRHASAELLGMPCWGSLASTRMGPRARAAISAPASAAAWTAPSCRPRQPPTRRGERGRAEGAPQLQPAPRRRPEGDAVRGGTLPEELLRGAEGAPPAMTCPARRPEEPGGDRALATSTVRAGRGVGARHAAWPAASTLRPPRAAPTGPSTGSSSSSARTGPWERAPAAPVGPGAQQAPPEQGQPEHRRLLDGPVQVAEAVEAEAEGRPRARLRAGGPAARQSSAMQPQPSVRFSSPWAFMAPAGDRSASRAAVTGCRCGRR